MEAICNCNMDILVIEKDITITKIMQSADIFQSFDVAAKIHRITTVGTTTETNPQAILGHSHHKLMQNMDERIVFFHVFSVRMDNEEYYTNKDFPPYFKHTVSSIHTYGAWALLVDYVKKLIGDDFEIEEGLQRTIKRITPKYPGKYDLGEDIHRMER